MKVASCILTCLVAVFSASAGASHGSLQQPPAAIQVTVSLDSKAEVWSEPSSESKKIATLKAGEKVLIVGYLPAEGFFAVQYKAKTGYVMATRIPRSAELDAVMARGNALAPAPAKGTAPRLDNRAAKLQVLTMIYGRQTAAKLMEGKTWVGMSKEMVIQSIGEPKSVKKVVFSNIIKEHWKYADGLDLYFENDTLKAIGGLPPGIQPLEPTRIPPGPAV
jgi:hypothetical protein